MGNRIRTFEPNVVYSAVISCVDRQFLFKPDHHPRHPLLSHTCHPRTLYSHDNSVPDPSVINIIGAAAARAQRLAPINLHWVEANINHLQVGFSASADQLPNIPAFFRNLHSNIAGRLNKKWRREGHLFGATYRPTPCLDDRAAEQQLVYSVTNPVKDGLVEAVRESPFFTTFRYLARGEGLRFFRIDWAGYYAAGGPRKKSHCVKDYLEWEELRLAPLPGQEGWAAHRRQAWARAQVRAVEGAVREELRVSGRRAVGARALFRLDPRERPVEPRVSGPQPLCHGSDPEERREHARRVRETRREHRKASVDYLAGMWEREFPEGTYRPPLIKPYQSSRL